MNGIIINIDPAIFHIGGFELRWYSLAIITAIIAAVVISARQAKRNGIQAAEIYNVAPWVVLGGMVGARLVHVIDQWGYYAANPLQILMVQQGGLAIWGAMVGGGLAVMVYSRVRHISFGSFLDTIVPGLLVAQIIGRFGCIVNGDAYGGYTDLPWAFIYVHPGAMIPPELAGVPTHPYPVYEIIWNVAVLGVMLLLRSRLKRPGMLFLAYGVFYSIGRFALTFVRQENVWLWGLQQAQVLALGILFVSAVWFAYMAAKAGRTPAPVPSERPSEGA